jgi:RNA polymerase sigma factor (sigma-70 family)
LAILRTGTAVWEDDLVQESLLRGVKAFRRTAHVEHPSAFFSKIVRDTVRDHWRRQRVMRPLNSVRQDDLVHVPKIEERLHRSQQIGRIRKALRTLPPVQREMMELFYFEGLSVEELSTSSGKSLSAIKMTLLRGRNQIIQAVVPAGK